MDELSALRASVTNLHDIVEHLAPDQLEGQAYPTEWTVAHVLSHLGSGATIMKGDLEDQIAGRATDPAFAQSVWDEWNAKAPADQAADMLTIDGALMDRLESLTDEERDGFSFSMGPMTLDLAGFVGLRLNEHALHTWDVEVALDPAATVLPAATEVVIDHLGMIVGFSAKPTGVEHAVHVHATDPTRDITVAFGAESVALEEGTGGSVDLELPAEAFVRLIYGRLDPDHTPVAESPVLDELRLAFPGI